MTRRQCDKCPWRRDVDPREIPRGYSEAKHKALACTIADPGAPPAGPALHLMACHEFHAEPCVGWLAHQLGPGNNIPLRLAVLAGHHSGDFELVGEQHETFEQTLPKPEGGAE